MFCVAPCYFDWREYYKYTDKQLIARLIWNKNVFIKKTSRLLLLSKQAQLLYGAEIIHTGKMQTFYMLKQVVFIAANHCAFEG